MSLDALDLPTAPLTGADGLGRAALPAFTIVGARVLTPDGFADACLHIDGARIAAVTDGPVRHTTPVRADGLLALPGIVDLHGDAFERQWMPRPQVRFPLDLALADTDRQLAANGITTAFHGITWSWEGGLRGGASARAIIDALRGDPQRAQDGVPADGTDPGAHGRCGPARFAVDHRVHLRFETHTVADGAAVAAAIKAGRIDFLAFNDHLDDIARKCERQPAKRASYAERADTSDDEFMRRLDAARERRDEVGATIETLAGLAREHGIAMASHDDLRSAERAYYHRLGVEVAEFPRSLEAIEAARALGSRIVLGAPNVVRGGSHCGAVDAARSVLAGQCDVLTSDYYYPALLAAPFVLAQVHGVELAAAWRLVSTHPAQAARLHDRGALARGMRADVLLVDAVRPTAPRVVAAFVAGRAVYLAQALR